MMLCLAFLMIGCSSIENNKDEKQEVILDQKNDVIEEVVIDTTLQLDEKALFEALEKKIAIEITNEQRIFDDFDFDQMKELIVTFMGDDHLFHMYYVNYDASIINEVYTSSIARDAFQMEIIDVQSAKHIVMNEYTTMGTNMESTVFALKDHQLEVLFQGNGASISQGDDGSIHFHVEDYDMMYDPTIEGYVGHSYKYSYLYYDDINKVYKEYGAKEISENDFLEYENADTILNNIKNELEEEGVKEVRYKYFIRSNHMMHIQYEKEMESGFIDYAYYTLEVKDQALVLLDEVIGGQMKDHFSNLGVTY